MHPSTPNMTPLMGVLLVVFIAVSTDWRLLTIDVPQPRVACGLVDASVGVRVSVRPDLSASIRSGQVTAETGPTGFAQLLRATVDAARPDDAPVPPIVIQVESDDEVRWGDLVSTFDTIRGVAPEASIALVPAPEWANEGWR